MGKLKIIVLCLLAAFLWQRCRSNGAKVPHDLISQSEMRNMIGEMLIADAWAQIHQIRLDSQQFLANKLFAEILKRHHYTKKQTYESLKYYSSEPEIMAEDYKILVDSLSSMEARLRQIPK